MRRRIVDSTLELIQGDIIRQQSDAIVNAANNQLIPGGGVDGAIHKAGGPQIAEETARLYPHGCETGHALASGAGQLPAKWIFHAVGPVWQGGRQQESKLLRSAYRSCLQLALDHKCRSISFPAISTGIYGYPLDRAATDALESIVDFLKDLKEPGVQLDVTLVLFGSGAYGAFSRVLETLLPES